MKGKSIGYKASSSFSKLNFMCLSLILSVIAADTSSKQPSGEDMMARFKVQSLLGTAN